MSGKMERNEKVRKKIGRREERDDPTSYFIQRCYKTVSLEEQPFKLYQRLNGAPKC